MLAAHIPVMPPFIQHVVARRAGELAYVPTRKPFGYRYRSYTFRDGRLTIRLVDPRYPNPARHTVLFGVQRFAGTASSCADGKTKTLQLDGNKVYWDGETAWRCARAPSGRLVKLTASGPSLPDVALGIVVASGKRVT